MIAIGSKMKIQHVLGRAMSLVTTDLFAHLVMIVPAAGPEARGRSSLGTAGIANTAGSRTARIESERMIGEQVSQSTEKCKQKDKGIIQDNILSDRANRT